MGLSEKITSIFFRAGLIVFILLSGSPVKTSAFQNEPVRNVKIGLLIPDSRSTAALNGAELAIRKANEAGDITGFFFQLLVKTLEGPWGTGSKQAVSLIFEDKVWALSGSHDGRNAHIVEQAATKSQVVFLSSWSGDPTLSQAFVPWFFNCVPNDSQQAEALIEEIYNKRKTNRVAVIYDEDYDSRQAYNNLIRQINLKGISNPLKFRYEDYKENIDKLLDQVKLKDISNIILFCTPPASHEIFLKIRQRRITQTVFGSIFILNEDMLTTVQLRNFNNSLLIPSGRWMEEKSESFTREYRLKYGKEPGMVAAYAYDGMNVLIEAIRDAGSPDYEKIQKALSEIKYEGITGTISFDSMGNRSENITVTEVRNGMPVPVSK